jgi:uncharacterized protein (TIGR03067 family)
MTRFLMLAAGFGLTAVVMAAEPAESLVGGYTIVGGERDGKPLPEEKYKGSVVRFTKDEVIGTDKDTKQIFVAKYTLDTAKTPWVIKMTSTAPAQGEATGLVEKKGDTIRIIYNLPGGAAPDDFKTDAKQNLFVLKNENKKGRAAGKSSDDR